MEITHEQLLQVIGELEVVRRLLTVENDELRQKVAALEMAAVEQNGKSKKAVSA